MAEEEEKLKPLINRSLSIKSNKLLGLFSLFIFSLACNDNCERINLHNFRFEEVNIVANKEPSYYDDNHFEPSFFLKNGIQYFNITIYNPSVYYKAKGMLKVHGDTVILSYQGKSTLYEKLIGPSARMGFYKIEFEICGLKSDRDYIIKFKNPESVISTHSTFLKIDHKRISEIFDSINKVNVHEYLLP